MLISKPLKFRIVSCVVLVVPLAIALCDQFFFSDWRWESERIYSLIDGIGGTIAVFLALVLFFVQKHRVESPSLIFPIYGLLAGGVLLEFKSFTENMVVSIWLDSSATFLGGSFFALSWLEHKFPKKPSPLVIGLGAVVFSGLTFLYSERLPVPYAQNGLIFPLREIHLMGGAGFFLGAVRYRRSFVRTYVWEDGLITLLCLYSGIAAMLYPFWPLWRANWWLLQALQLIPFLVALHYIFALFEQKERALLESEERFRRLFEDAPLGIGIVGKDYRFISANPALCKLFGYSKEEISLIDIGRLTHRDSIHVARLKRAELLSGKISQYQQEKLYLTRNGKTIWTNVIAAVIRNKKGQIVNEFRLIEDITDRKTREENLRKLVDELSRSNTELERFTHVVSHDLKSPLNTVISFITLLKRKVVDNGNEETQEYLILIEDAAKRMRALIEDLLIYSRVSKGEPRRETISCNQLLEEILSNLKADIEESGARVEIKDLPTIMADKIQLLQLFQNLISNAIKFRGEAAPEIVVGAQKKDGHWLFSVKDNGIGFAEEYVEKIFRPFERLHGMSEYEGTGLGLSICSTIVERWGGRIWATSRPAMGTTFFFTVPIRSLEQTPASRAPAYNS